MPDYKCANPDCEIFATPDELLWYDGDTIMNQQRRKPRTPVWHQGFYCHSCADIIKTWQLEGFAFKSTLGDWLWLQSFRETANDAPNITSH